MAILEVQNIFKYFATQKAVDDVSFSIEKGSIFGLLGPNGAGKTTLLRMITGIIYPDRGNILLHGRALDAEKQANEIGYMPEERGLYKKMKIGEQAIYLARLKGLSKKDAEQKVKSWFVRLNMESWWDKKVEDLSKGMSQKLQFVTTVAHDPSLIILDEPFSGLDPVNANLIKDEIFNLAKNGATIIFSTHRMEQVEEICDHIILVNKGRKILDGSVRQVKQDFKENIFEVRYEGQWQDAESNGLYDVLSDTGQTLRLKKGDQVRSNEVLKDLMNHGLELHEYREILPSLNDIFIRQVEGTSAARQFQKI